MFPLAADLNDSWRCLKHTFLSRKHDNRIGISWDDDFFRLQVKLEDFFWNSKRIPIPWNELHLITI